MKEIWKDIKGYEGLYQVSNLGRVKSLNYRHTGRERILKSKIDRYGYLQVVLCKNNEKRSYTIHRLVAEYFLENVDNYPCINHKDENKENNKVNNLEWCSYRDNCNYGTRNQRMIENKNIPIYCLETDKMYKSATECSKELGLRQQNIVSVLKGRMKQTGNLTFRYANQVLYKGVE